MRYKRSSFRSIVYWVRGSHGSLYTMLNAYTHLQHLCTCFTVMNYFVAFKYVYVYLPSHFCMLYEACRKVNVLCECKYSVCDEKAVVE